MDSIESVWMKCRVTIMFLSLCRYSGNNSFNHAEFLLCFLPPQISGCFINPLFRKYNRICCESRMLYNTYIRILPFLLFFRIAVYVYILVLSIRRQNQTIFRLFRKVCCSEIYPIFNISFISPLIL